VSYHAGGSADHRGPQPAGPWHGKYKPPASWKNPAVGGKNLMVSGDQLKTVARSLAGMADQLHTELKRWQASATPASHPAAAGEWEAATQLSGAIAKTHLAVSQFATDLADTHNEVASVLTRSADHYDEAEHATLAAIKSAASGTSATLIQSGGVNQPLHDRHHDDRNIWNASYKVTADAPFRSGSVAHYNWQQINKMIKSTDPDAITNAGYAYQSLYEQLTDIASQLASHGESLAESWAGRAAVSAVSQVQMMHQTAAGLQSDTWRASQALTWFGPVLRQSQASLAHPATVPPPRLDPEATSLEARAASQEYTTLAAAHVSAATQAAQRQLAQLNAHIEVAYNAMPADVQKNLPPVPGSPASGGHGPTGRQPGGPPQSTLAGFTGPTLSQPGGPGAGMADGMTPGSSAAAGGIGPLGTGGSAGGLGQAGAASGDAPFGFPMMGGGLGGTSSSGGAGRARESWEVEDEQTWEPSGEQQVIGDGSGIGADGVIGGQINRRTRKWMSEHGWDDDEQDIPPMIG
jgi:uncharacterized protein YukE